MPGQEPASSHLLPYLRRAKDLIDRAYADPLDLATLAAEAGCSRFHFLRSFQAAYGETPGRYLTQRRIERARDLLRATNLTVAEICHMVGYSSVGSFSSRFSGIVGVSPTAYRDEIVRRGGPPPIPGCYLFMCARRPAATSDLPGTRPERPSDGPAGASRTSRDQSGGQNRNPGDVTAHGPWVASDHRSTPEGHS
ncbi:helix-turn-helix domain-containing protein [Streptomyces sp. CB03234]|uniref:helix-turn-helix domain-containing protein n=1 Tax=Streptomyces sp. (strain CB03234) TaxID=1703937 RepID=UPI00076F3355|nr:AraC family transcriptional regulator [Streptomyces sp. CB03234]